MDAQQKPSKPQSSRVFDILPPGKVRPAPTSRPVIVGNQNEQSDTMLKPAETEAATPEPEKKPAITNIPIKENFEENETVAETPEPKAPEPTPEPEQPAIEPEPKHDEEPVALLGATDQEFVVAHHEQPKSKKAFYIILFFVLLIILLVIIADLLLDDQIIKSSLPHTHFLKPVSS